MNDHEVSEFIRTRLEDANEKHGRNRELSEIQEILLPQMVKDMARRQGDRLKAMEDMLIEFIDVIEVLRRHCSLFEATGKEIPLDDALVILGITVDGTFPTKGSNPF